MQVFFLISGWLVLRTAQGRSLREFAIARAARIVPTFWMACLVTTGLLVVLDFRPPSIGAFFANFSLLPLTFRSLLSTEHKFAFVDSAYWTLGYELRSEGFSWPRVVAAFGCFGLAVPGLLELAQFHGESTGAVFHPQVLIGTVVAAFALFAWLALRREGIGTWRLDSAWTYPGYLLHQYLGFALLQRVSPDLPPGIVFGVVLVLVVGASMVWSRWGERRLNATFRRGLERLWRRPLQD